MFTHHQPIHSINTQIIEYEAVHKSDVPLSDENAAQCAFLPNEASFR
jgi:hypothetical protein